MPAAAGNLEATGFVEWLAFIIERNQLMQAQPEGDRLFLPRSETDALEAFQVETRHRLGDLDICRATSAP